MKNIIFLILFLTCALYLSSQENVEYYGLKLKSDKNKSSEIIKSDSRVIQNSKYNEKILVGDRINSNSNEILTVNFSDGAIFEINPGGSVYIKSIVSNFDEVKKDLFTKIIVQVFGQVDVKIPASKQYIYEIYDHNNRLLGKIDGGYHVMINKKGNVFYKEPKDDIKIGDRNVLINYTSKINLNSLQEQVQAYRYDGSKYFEDKEHTFVIGDTIKTLDYSLNLINPDYSSLTIAPNSSVTFYSFEKINNITTYKIKSNYGSFRVSFKTSNQNILKVINKGNEEVLSLTNTVDAGYNELGDIYLQYGNSIKVKGKTLSEFYGYSKDTVSQFTQDYLDENFPQLGFLDWNSKSKNPHQAGSDYPDFGVNDHIIYPYKKVAYQTLLYPHDFWLMPYYSYDRSNITEIRYNLGGFRSKHTDSMFFELLYPYDGIRNNDDSRDYYTNPNSKELVDAKYYDPPLSYLSDLENKNYTKEKYKKKDVYKEAVSFKEVSFFHSGVVYNKIFYTPNFNVDGFRMGFSIPFSFDYSFESNKFLPNSDWDFGTNTSDTQRVSNIIDDKIHDTIYDIVSKIDYIDYSSPEKPFFMRLGEFEDFNIANGFFIHNYDNSPSMFLNKTKGFDLGILTSQFQVEAFISDISNPIMGAFELNAVINKSYPLRIGTSVFYDFSNNQKYLTKKELEQIYGEKLITSTNVGASIQLDLPVMWQKMYLKPQEQFYISLIVGALFVFGVPPAPEGEIQSSLKVANKIGGQMSFNYYTPDIDLVASLFYGGGQFYPGYINKTHEKTGFIREGRLIYEKATLNDQNHNFGLSIDYTHRILEIIALRFSYHIPITYKNGHNTFLITEEIPFNTPGGISISDDTFIFGIETSPFLIKSKNGFMANFGLQFVYYDLIGQFFTKNKQILSGKMSINGMLSFFYKDNFKTTIFFGLDNVYKTDGRFVLKSKSDNKFDIDQYIVAGIYFEIFNFSSGWFKFSNKNYDKRKYIEYL